MLAMIADWRAFLNSAMPEEELRDLRELAIPWEVRRLWSVSSEPSAESSVPEHLDARPNYANDHNRFVSPP
jgi:hypothetical protein